MKPLDQPPGGGAGSRGFTPPHSWRPRGGSVARHLPEVRSRGPMTRRNELVAATARRGAGGQRRVRFQRQAGGYLFRHCSRPTAVPGTVPRPMHNSPPADRRPKPDRPVDCWRTLGGRVPGHPKCPGSPNGHNVVSRLRTQNAGTDRPHSSTKCTTEAPPFVIASNGWRGSSTLEAYSGGEQAVDVLVEEVETDDERQDADGEPDEQVPERAWRAGTRPRRSRHTNRPTGSPGETPPRR